LEGLNRLFTREKHLQTPTHTKGGKLDKMNEDDKKRRIAELEKRKETNNYMATMLVQAKIHAEWTLKDIQDAIDRNDEMIRNIDNEITKIELDIDKTMD
jgi:DNA integrity scanning protein DisA with diadenylate cyclase activity